MTDQAALYITGGDAIVLGKILSLAGDQWPNATVSNGRDPHGHPCYILHVPHTDLDHDEQDDQP